MSRCLKAWLLAVLALLGSTAMAHELSMAEMQLREVTRGEFTWQWLAGDKGNPSEEMTPLWPAACRAEGSLLRCGAAGLSGTMEVDGVGRRFSAVMVKVLWQDGQTRVYTITAGQPRVQLYGAADDPRGLGDIASAYSVLGVEHILTGWDHLAFVIGLLFLVGFRKQLLWTITAFTAAHSLTLGLSALSILTLRPPPVEASIALSIMLVSAEALHQRPTWSRRWPAAVAFLFGLVHGLGFAGALKEIGLPEQHLAAALLSFNVGVEIGQLLVLLACWTLWRVIQGHAHVLRARTAALYGIGGVAAYWSIGRIATLLA